MSTVIARLGTLWAFRRSSCRNVSPSRAMP